MRKRVARPHDLPADNPGEAWTYSAEKPTTRYSGCVTGLFTLFVLSGVAAWFMYLWDVI